MLPVEFTHDERKWISQQMGKNRGKQNGLGCGQRITKRDPGIKGVVGVKIAQICVKKRWSSHKK